MEFEVKSPILGFEQVSKMRLEKVDDIFMKIYNAHGDQPTFSLVNPFALRDYSFEIPTAIQVLLDLDSNKSDIFIANIMVLHKNIEDSTINFLAPLVFNFSNHTMAQVVLDAFKYPQYSISEPISTYIKKTNNE